MSLKDDIFAIDDRAKEKVDFTGVKGWEKINLYVIAFGGEERDAFEQYMVDAKKSGKPLNFRAHLAAWSCVDEKGNGVFKSDEDVAKLGTKSAHALDKIYALVIKLNALNQSDVDELEKN